MSSNKYISPYTTSSPVHYINNKDFSLVESPDFFRAGCGWESLDPRTFNSPRAQRLSFDRPPIKTKNTLPLEGIYTKENVAGVYTGFYPDYASIKGGNIIYYTDKNFSAPYGYPNHVLPSKVTPTIFTDPMETKSTIYLLEPLFQKNNNLFPYSFDQDQVKFREDIMSRQTRNMNKNSYQSYYFFKEN
jgi:hypothetical protein